MENAEDYFLRAVDIVKSGGVIIHATEGVFGFAGSVQSAVAQERISSLKGRDAQVQPFLVLIGDIADVTTLASPKVAKWPQVLASWPGPNTWIFPCKTNTYPWLGGADGSLAIRMPGHLQALELAKAAGPLISTSANRSGEPACLRLDQAEQEFGTLVDLYLPGNLDNPGQPSRISHAASGDLIRN